MLARYDSEPDTNEERKELQENAIGHAALIGTGLTAVGFVAPTFVHL